MNFSQALELIKEGKSVKRSNWTDKGIALHNHPYQVHKKILTGEETLHTSHLFIQVYEEGGYTPWSPTQRDLLEDDWEEIESTIKKGIIIIGDGGLYTQGGTVTLNKDEVVLNNQQNKDFISSMKVETYEKDEDNEVHTEDSKSEQDELLNVLEKLIDDRVEEAIKKNKKNESLAENIMKTLVKKGIQR